MMLNEVWLLCLAVATPVAGVVGFAIQIRTVRKVRLESAKLELEIQRLRRELENSQHCIVMATKEDIERYSDVKFMRLGPDPGPDELEPTSFSSILAALVAYAVLALVVLFVVYLCFDLYRLGAWVWTFISEHL